MKRLMQLLMRLVYRKNSLNADERYLAQVADHQDFEVRVRALEQRSP